MCGGILHTTPQVFLPSVQGRREGLHFIVQIDVRFTSFHRDFQNDRLTDSQLPLRLAMDFLTRTSNHKAGFHFEGLGFQGFAVDQLDEHLGGHKAHL